MDRKNLQFWMIIVMLVIWFLISAFMFVYFKRECSIAKQNPLEYGAERYDVDRCTCFKTSGTIFFFNKTRVWRVEREISFDIINITWEKDVTSRNP